MQSLQTICGKIIADVRSPAIDKRGIEDLPRTVLPCLLLYLSASDLHELQHKFEKEGISTEETWKKHLELRWGGGQTSGKFTDVFGEVNSSLHQHYMSKHVMDVISFLTYKNSRDPKLMFTTRLDKIPLLKRHQMKEDRSPSTPSCLDDLYPLAQHVHTFHLFSHQINLLMNNWKIVEHFAKGVVRLIIHNVTDAGYFSFKSIVHFLIEHGSVDHIVVVFPRLCRQYLSDLICLCAGHQDNGFSEGKVTAWQKRDSSRCIKWHARCIKWHARCIKWHAFKASSIGSSVDTEQHHSVVATTDSGEKIRTLASCSLEPDSPSFSNASDANTSEKRELNGFVKGGTSVASSSSVQGNGIESNDLGIGTSGALDYSELKLSPQTGVGECEYQNEDTGNCALNMNHIGMKSNEMKRTLHLMTSGDEDDTNGYESNSKTKLLKTDVFPDVSNHHSDMDSSDEIMQDLFDEALMLPVASAKNPTDDVQNSSKIGTLQGANCNDTISPEFCCTHTKIDGLSSAGPEPTDCDTFMRNCRGVKRFVLSHSFCSKPDWDPPDVDALAMILCQALNCWPDLRQFAMMHVEMEGDKPAKSYVQLLKVLQDLVLRGQLTHLVLQDTRMPCHQYRLPLMFKRANFEMKPLKLLQINNVIDASSLQSEDEDFWELSTCPDSAVVDYNGANHLHLVDSRSDWKLSFTESLLLVLKHDRSLRQFTWHSVPKLSNDVFASIIDTIIAVNRLEYLEIKYILMGSAEREEALVRLIKNATSLRVLKVSECDLQPQLVESDDFVKALANSNIREICLSENNFGDKVLTAMNRVLQCQQSCLKLTNIDLSENCLSVNGLKDFGEKLGTMMTRHNQPILKKLSIDGNIYSFQEQNFIHSVFSRTVRKLSAKINSNYSGFAEFEAQM